MIEITIILLDELKSILIELNLENKNLGVEYEAYGLTGRNAMMLNKSLNNFAKLHDESFLDNEDIV